MEGTAGRGVLLRFCVATLLFRASLYVYVPTLAPYAQVLGAPLSTIGLILAAYGFTQLALRIPLGSGLGLAFAPGARAALGCWGGGAAWRREAAVGSGVVGQRP